MRTVELSKELCEAIRAYNEVTDAVVDLKAELERTPEWTAFQALEEEYSRLEPGKVPLDLYERHEAARIALAKHPTSERFHRATNDRRILGHQLTPLVEAELGIRTTKMSAT